MASKLFPINRVLTILQKESKHWDAPVVALVAAREDDPFLTLVSAMLSARTQDKTTAPVTTRLFKKYRTPRAFAKLSTGAIARLIYPVSFYKTKARHLKALSQRLLTEYRGKVPSDLDALLTLPGVGRKTANLVLGEAFGKAGICVDTHVHRITNRWGYVRTKTPHKTEMALRAKLPKNWWIRINPILVAFGQTQCTPIAPKCSTCPVRQYCPRIGVVKSR